MSRTATALLWLATRGLVLLLFFGPQSWVTGDVSYFAQSLDHLGAVGLGQTLVEYPPPAVAVLAIPWEVTHVLGHPGWYSDAILALAVMTDAGFLALLHRFGRVRRPLHQQLSLGTWLLAVPLLGATTYARFDLVPGVLVGIAVLLMVSHPRVAAVAAAVATGVKFWPALVLPALTARAKDRLRMLYVVVVVGAVLAVGSLAVGGWSRLVSPLTWQADRGLQIESVLATPAMIGWALAPGGLKVAYSDHNAYEISGRGVSVLLAATTLLSVLLVVGLFVLWWRAWRCGGRLGAETVAWLCLASITGFMVTSKVLSPQYLLWLLPAAAAALAMPAHRQDLLRDRRLVRWVVVLLVATGLTQLEFPVWYGGLVRHGPESSRAVLVLAIRNALLLWLTVLAWGETWSRLDEDAQRGRALERQPPGPEGSDRPMAR